jgi:hypothetical protein
MLVRELTELMPYGPDGNEGDGRDADLEEVTGQVRPNAKHHLTVSLFLLFTKQLSMFGFTDCCTRMYLHTTGRSMIQRRNRSERSWTLGGSRRARVGWGFNWRGRAAGA